MEIINRENEKNIFINEDLLNIDNIINNKKEDEKKILKESKSEKNLNSILNLEKIKNPEKKDRKNYNTHSNAPKRNNTKNGFFKNPPELIYPTNSKSSDIKFNYNKINSDRYSFDDTSNNSSSLDISLK